MKELTLMPIAPPETVLLILGVGTMLFCVPLLLRMVKPNRVYGIRVPAAFESEANWYRINSYGAKCLFVFGAVETLMGIALNMTQKSPFWLPILCLVATLPLVLVTVGAIKRFARSL